MSVGDYGDNRDGAWVFTCDRWRDQSCYLALPVNPESLNIPHALRADQSQTKRGKIVYIQREHSVLGSTVFQPFDLQFQISSGNIIPTFKDSYKFDVRAASQAIAEAKADGNFGEALARESDFKKTYGFSRRLPGPGQHADYTAGKVFENIDTKFASHYPNVPDLYQSDVPIGIQNLYAFIALADEQRYYRNSPNKIRVFINTLGFPAMMLTCAFGSELQWAESADSLGEVTMSFTLRVINTMPRFSYGQMHQFFYTYQHFLAKQETNLEFAIQAFDGIGCRV